MNRLRLPVFALLLGLVPGVAEAFTHVVMPGESLAQISERTYGDSRWETVLVGANALDVQGGSVIVPGMRIEIPAPTHHRIVAGETWESLAFGFLGSRAEPRAKLLALANGGVPWVPPIEGQEVEIPAVLTHLAGDGESMAHLAKRYWGNQDLSWQLNEYNDRKGADLKRGEVVLVPISSLKLTEAGKLEARQAAERDGAASLGVVLDLQRKADAELEALLSDVRHGRYTEAIARGNRLAGGGVLTHPQMAIIYRALLESYVAEGANEAAVRACATWRQHEPSPLLDPIRVSPKIREACKAP